MPPLRWQQRRWPSNPALVASRAVFCRVTREISAETAGYARILCITVIKWTEWSPYCRSLNSNKLKYCVFSLGPVIKETHLLLGLTVSLRPTVHNTNENLYILYKRQLETGTVWSAANSFLPLSIFPNFKDVSFPGLFANSKHDKEAFPLYHLPSMWCWHFWMHSFQCVICGSQTDIFFHPWGDECVWTGINGFELARRLTAHFQRRPRKV